MRPAADARVGKIFILAGAALLVIGLVLTFAPNALGWFGRLPGDIRVEGEHGGFYFPLVSMLIVSIVLSALSYCISRW